MCAGLTPTGHLKFTRQRLHKNLNFQLIIGYVLACTKAIPIFSQTLISCITAKVVVSVTSSSPLSNSNNIQNAKFNYLAFVFS